MAFKVKIDKEKCINCGACVAVCDNFKMEDGITYVVNEKVDEIGCNQDAHDSCPVQAISIEEIKE